MEPSAGPTQTSLPTKKSKAAVWLETKTGPTCTAAVQCISTGRTIEFYVSLPRREKLLTDIIIRHFWAFWAPDPWNSMGFIGGLRGPQSQTARHIQPGVGPGPGDFHENSNSRPTVIKSPPEGPGRSRLGQPWQTVHSSPLVAVHGARYEITRRREINKCPVFDHQTKSL